MPGNSNLLKGHQRRPPSELSFGYLVTQMEKKIDLHVHSTASDGRLEPEELIALAVKEGLCAMALTDHDTIDGVKKAKEAADKTGLELIPGVELSTEYKGYEIHVVGLYIDIENKPLLAQLTHFQQMRDTRNLRMLERLREEGFSITMEDLMKDQAEDCVITRANIARYLLDTNQVADMKTVFDEYIGNGCKCYVERDKITPMEAVTLIKNAGGIAILAHPVLYHMPEPELCGMIEQMKTAGLDGMETIYSCNEGADEAYYTALASRYDLLPSGGSDFHGSNKPDIFLGRGKNNIRVPYSVLQNFKKLLL